MHTYDAHGLPYFISSSGVMQFREACYTAVSYAPYILLQIYATTILATFGVTIFEFFHPGTRLKEKNSKKFSLYAFTAEQGWISAKNGKC